MPYVRMQDVKLGMDRKRASRVASELGSAWTIKNGHLTRGGDVQRRKSFVQQAGSFPSTTVGLYAINETLYTCGYDASEAGNVPASVTHLLTQHPTPATAIDSIKDAEPFDGDLYSIIEYTDGNIYHFNSTTRVTDWDTLATTIGSNNAVASALAAAIDNSVAVNATSSTDTVTITSATAGTAFTIAKATVNNGSNPDQDITLTETQPNVEAVTEVLATADVTVTGGTADSGTNNMVSVTVDGVNILGGDSEVLATGSIDITGGTSNPGTNTVDTITVDGVDILGTAVDWDTSDTQTASDVADQINAHTSSPNYTAVNDGATIDITAVAGSGSSPNGFVVGSTSSGDVTLGSAVNMASGAYAGVPWVTSNSATAEDIADAINAETSSPNYTASASGPVVTISAVAGSGAGPNSFVVVTNEAGDVTSTHDATMTGGISAVTAVAQVYTAQVSGTFETADQFQITINGIEEYLVTGAASGTGVSVLTFKQKMYSTASSNLYFSALGSSTQWISGTDFGFINMASQTAGEESLTVAQEYQGLMAIFSENNIRIWSISEDSAANVFLQTLQNTGTIAPGSVVPYGNNDVFYLDTSGIRSIKARDSSNAAYVSDVGTPIDTHIRAYMDTLTEEEIAAANGIVEPIEGRFWLGIKNRIYVLSYFPAAKVTAWSYYEVDFEVKHFAKVGDRIYVRGTDNGTDYLYLYGGANNDTYPDADEDICSVEFPYFDAENPAAFKDLLGFDIIGINDWVLEILPDPADDTKKISQGTASGTTYGKPRFGATGVTSLFAVNLTCSAAGQATLSALAMHYSGTFEDG
jgi:hypothetical protein